MKKLLLTLIAVLVIILIAGAVYVWRRPMAVFTAMNRRALTSAGFTRTETSTPVGIQVSWEAGNGPALILLHGAGDHAGTWSKAAPALTSQYRVIALDLAGHGESEPRTGPISMGAMLTALESVIAQRASSAPVTLVGNSMGAWLAMLYAQRHPERVSRIVLVNGGAVMGHRPDLAFLPRTRAEVRRLFDNIMDPGSPKPPDFVLDDIARQSQNGPLARLEAASSDWQMYLLDGKLAEFRTPVDLLWGEADQLMSLEYARRMAADLPAVRLTSIPRCGHIPQQECPKTFTMKLKELLAQPAPSPNVESQSAAGK